MIKAAPIYIEQFPPRDGNNVPLGLIPAENLPRTLLHHIVQGIDLVRRWSDGSVGYCELKVVVSDGVFSHLCEFDADGDPDHEEVGDDEPGSDAEPDQAGRPWPGHIPPWDHSPIAREELYHPPGWKAKEARPHRVRRRRSRP